MKKLLLFIVICITPVFAQSNPDGDFVSIHFTPVFNNYSSNLNDRPLYEVKGEYSYRIMVKIPVTKSFTISPFYTNDDYEYRLNDFYGHDKYKISQSSYGVKLSFYFNQ